MIDESCVNIIIIILCEHNNYYMDIQIDTVLHSYYFLLEKVCIPTIIMITTPLAF